MVPVVYSWNFLKFWFFPVQDTQLVFQLPVIAQSPATFPSLIESQTDTPTDTTKTLQLDLQTINNDFIFYFFKDYAPIEMQVKDDPSGIPTLKTIYTPDTRSSHQNTSSTSDTILSITIWNKPIVHNTLLHVLCLVYTTYCSLPPNSLACCIH